MFFLQARVAVDRDRDFNMRLGCTVGLAGALGPRQISGDYVIHSSPTQG